MKLGLLERIITYALPIVSVAVSYILGRVQSVKSEKRKVLEESYLSFFVPYITQVYLCRAWEVRLSDLSSNVSQSLLDLAFKNVQCMSNEAIEQFTLFYEGYIYREATKSKEGLAKHLHRRAEDQVQESFDRMTISILSQSLGLSTKLYKPKIAEHALAMYAQSNRMKEIERQAMR